MKTDQKVRVFKPLVVRNGLLLLFFKELNASTRNECNNCSFQIPRLLLFNNISESNGIPRDDMKILVSVFWPDLLTNSE